MGKDYDANGRIILNIEPGLAFGTGSHPTTRLCLEMLEEYVNDESTVLDIGCGSGILSIAALLLGAKSAFGTDIDELAVKTAIENAKKNGFEPPVFTAEKVTFRSVQAAHINNNRKYRCRCCYEAE